MDRRTFLQRSAEAGLLVSAGGGGAALLAAESERAPYAEFFALPIYRCYVRGVRYRDLPPDYLEALATPSPLDLVREPDNRHDRKAIAVYHEARKLGYLPREDNLVLAKLIRRGLPVAARLVGVNPGEASHHQLAVEVALLYPPHPTTDERLVAAETDRYAGLARVGAKPPHARHQSADPLSAGHVDEHYYRGFGLADEPSEPARRARQLDSFVSRFAALIIACLMAACSPISPDAHAPLGAYEVRTDEGVVSGFGESRVARWYGIPFAAPPVADLRWRAPQPAPIRDTVLAATRFAASPMSHNVWGDMRYRSPGFDEDCLYLNVWAPEGERVGLPVLLYFYGGGLIAGDASETRYDGAALARDSVIVVTANYRLNVFGLLAHPELSAESPRGASGNYSHLDQVAALEWVHANVAAFGGDPARITIGGESAGSISVSTLLGSPASRDRIAGAIGQSGASFAPLYEPVPLAEAERIGAAFAKTIGAPTLAELRALPADTLYARYLRHKVSLPLVLDGHVIAKPLLERYEAGEVPNVPLLAGWNSREQGPERLMGERALTPANFRAAVRERYPEHADVLLTLLPHATPAEVEASATRLASDDWIGQPTWAWTDAHARLTEGRVYRYYFDQARPGTSGGAVHAAEIPYALGNLNVHDAYDWTDDDRAASQTMRAYFANFVKTGNPNGRGLPRWMPVTPGAVEQLAMVIRAESRPERFDDAPYYLLRDHYRDAAGD